MNWNRNNWQDIYKNMSPEMREQVMAMAKAKIKEKILHWLSQPILIIASIFIGAIVGSLVAFFGQVLLYVGAIRDAHPVYWIPALALSGIAIVACYKKFGKGCEHGMNTVFAVAHGKESNIPLRLIPLVAVCTWVTHLFGGSSGREGVAMQIGGAFGQNISKKIPVENASRILLVAGMAAGFAGLFQTPLAAIALALEVLLVGHLELSALLPSTVAAFTACKVSGMLGISRPSIHLVDFAPDGTFMGLMGSEGGLDIYFILKLAVLGILFGIVGGLFAKGLAATKSFVAKKFPNPIKRVAVLGIIISVLLLIFDQGRYSGLGTNLIDICFASADSVDIFSTNPDIYRYDWILKFALTILTLSAGFQGGELTPLFSIGATFGTAIATLVGVPFPLAAALGFTAVFGSATNTLLAPILIGGEIFGFDALPLFFIVCVVSYACNGGQSVYAQKKLRIK